MIRQVITLDDGGLLLLYREGRRLVRVQYVAASVAAYYV